MIPDYSTTIEVPGSGATREQLARLHHRYQVASLYCSGKRVLEVGCGPGIGLGYLAQTASRVVGGDFTSNAIRMAQNHYRGRVHLLQLDAHALPFGDATFDTLVLFEALYYLTDPDQFLYECRRVLGGEGVLILCIVNKDWPEFNPSPSSVRYHSTPELFVLLTRYGFKTELFGAYDVTLESLTGNAVSLIKRTAVSLHLIPRSMRGKEWLKRIFYGRLVPLPAEIERDGSEETSLEPISNEDPTSKYKILYAIGYLQ